MELPLVKRRLGPGFARKPFAKTRMRGLEFAENQPRRHGLSIKTEALGAFNRHDISDAAGFGGSDSAFFQFGGDLIAQ